MGCATTIVKYLVFVCNALFAVGGIALIVVGTIYKIDLDEYNEHLEEASFVLAPILMIVLGCFIFVISCFGCFGAIKESNCLLLTYAIILLVIFALQLGLGIYSFVEFQDSSRDEVVNKLKEKLMKLVENYEPGSAIETYQKNLKCCGANGIGDYGPTIKFPKTCCKSLSETCSVNSGSDLQEKGCADAMYDYLDKNINDIGIAALVVAAIELVSSIVAFCLASSFRKKNKRRSSGSSYH